MKLKILTPTDPDFEAFESINRASFPANEYFRLELMAGREKEGCGELLGIYHDNKPVGFFSLLSQGKCVYICYFAMDPNVRGQGLGSQALKALQRRYEGWQIVVDFESVFIPCDNLEQRKRRRNFYLKNGFKPSGFYMFYMETEFEITSNTEAFDKAAFQKILDFIHWFAPSFYAEMYRK